ncbi:uncharacterized protein LOC113559276 [Rhopalosiphum maidis]|uniref:uncharacterized protein LOC113559276 n=1 Tax=Rhopalosiphum maidis TaxID=43146 RepID=UPI000EFDB4BB|nr:uncharacterized protein LOC113559276 [Rhopalosiphum maidis]
MNNKILQSFTIVAVMFFIIFMLFMKYIPLYRYVHGDNFNNISVSNGNIKNNTDLSPPIKSPILFLMVNFFYAYAIIIIIICFHGLYKFSVTNEMFSIEKCSRRSRGIENDGIGTSDIVLFPQVTEETELIPENIPLQILPEVPESKVIDNHCSWVGNWNKY